MAAFMSDYENSREDDYEAKLSKQVKRNEFLASHLQIPGIETFVASPLRDVSRLIFCVLFG